MPSAELPFFLPILLSCYVGQVAAWISRGTLLDPLVPKTKLVSGTPAEPKP